MYASTYGSAPAEPVVETLEEVRFVRAMNDAHSWDTSTATVEAILAFLTREPTGDRVE